jgi:hypothetical protein
MLHEFLTVNRDELIRRCRSKVSKRNSPPVTASELEYGVPLFLEQLVEALYCDQAGSAPGRALISGPWKNTSGALESSRTATLHGAELFAKGYTVDQVVHGYGDICQSITELAKEKRAPITVDEFHTFNRLLDNAIADAVSSYGRHQAPPPQHQRIRICTSGWGLWRTSSAAWWKRRSRRSRRSRSAISA